MSKYTLYASKMNVYFIARAYIDKLCVYTFYILVVGVNICASYERVSPLIPRYPRALAWENENENRLGFSFYNLSNDYIIHKTFFRTSPKNCSVNNLILIYEYLNHRVN